MQPPEVPMAARNETGHREGFSVLASMSPGNVRVCCYGTNTPGAVCRLIPRAQSANHTFTPVYHPSVHFRNSFCLPMWCGPRDNWAGKKKSVTVTAIYGVSVPDTSTQNTRLETRGAENSIRTQTQIPPKPNQGVVKTNPFSSFSLYWGARFPPSGNWSSETLTGPSSNGCPSLRPPRPPSELWEGSDINSYGACVMEYFTKH